MAITPVANVSMLTQAVGVIFGKIFAAVVIGAMIYIAILLYAKSKKVSKKAFEFIDIAAKVIGAFCFLGVMSYVTTTTPKAVIQQQTENIPASDFSLWPPILIILAIATITILLSFKKNTTFKSLKEPTYSPSKNPTSEERNFFESDFKASFDQKNNEWTLELLRKIEWRRFEYVCKAIFQELGLRTETIPFGADGGIDIKVYNEGSTHPDAIVQCKAWNTKQVGVKEMRELLGVMTDCKVGEGIFMITNDFHRDAIIFASNNNIDLKDGQDVISLVNKLPIEARQRIYKVATEGDYTTPTCASCGIKMIERDGFWGCKNYPKCKTKIYFKTA